MNQHIADWLQAHPVLFQYLIWPTVTALVLAIFHSRSPAEYAAMAARYPTWFWSRWAGFLVMLSGAGFDSAKVLEGLRRVLTGRSIPMDEAIARDLLTKVSIRPTSLSPADLKTIPPASPPPRIDP